jgi:hypothetical protein
MLTPLARRTYAPRGQTPIHRAWDRRERFSAISAVTLSRKRRRPGLVFRLVGPDRHIRAPEVVSFLAQLRAHLRCPFTVIWDRSNIHDRAKLVRAYLAKHPEIRTAKLPAYAPELNPDEQVWSYTKYARLANYAPSDAIVLRAKVEAELSNLNDLPDKLRAFIRHSGLPIRV